MSVGARPSQADRSPCWRRAERARGRRLDVFSCWTVLCAVAVANLGLIYVAFMFGVDVPMYWSCWLADEASGRQLPEPGAGPGRCLGPLGRLAPLGRLEERGRMDDAVLQRRGVAEHRARARAAATSP